MSQPTYLGDHTLRITGMTCDHCRRAVHDELTAIGGVEDVSVDLATGTVSLRTTRPVQQDEIAAAIDEAGYALDAR